MKKNARRISIGLLFLSMLAGLFALLATDAYARKPPKCTTCSQTITLPDGRGLHARGLRFRLRLSVPALIRSARA